MTDYERSALTFIDKIASMSDAELRRAYLECGRQCGDAWENALTPARAPTEACATPSMAGSDASALARNIPTNGPALMPRIVAD